MIEKILDNYPVPGTITSLEVFGEGHIHKTFLVETKEEHFPDYILQSINRTVFPDIDDLMFNMQVVTEHLMAKQGNSESNHTLTLVLTKEGKTFWTDENGDAWRLFYHIGNTRTHQQATSTSMAEEAGRIIGEFQCMMSDLQTKLHDTIPRFHSFNRRWEEYQDAKRYANSERNHRSQPMQEEYEERAELMKSYFNRLKSANIPVRVTHNDTKINNILFDRNNRGACMIDFDTVMNGYIHFDFGDALRTIACTTAEDEDDTTKVKFDVEIFEAFTKGYMDLAKQFLTDQEILLLPVSPLYMTWLIGLRFLTDYLNGDTYYNVSKPNHNLTRAKVQLQLLKGMEQNKKFIEDCLK